MFSGGEGANLARLARVGRINKVLKLLKLLRLAKLQKKTSNQMFEELSKYLNLTTEGMWVTYSFGGLLLNTHVLACIWIMIDRYTKEVSEFSSQDGDAYLKSLFFIMTTVVGEVTLVPE